MAYFNSQTHTHTQCEDAQGRFWLLCMKLTQKLLYLEQNGNVIFVNIWWVIWRSKLAHLAEIFWHLNFVNIIIKEGHESFLTSSYKLLALQRKIFARWERKPCDSIYQSCDLRLSRETILCGLRNQVFHYDFKTYMFKSISLGHKKSHLFHSFFIPIFIFISDSWGRKTSVVLIWVARHILGSDLGRRHIRGSDLGRKTYPWL